MRTGQGAKLQPIGSSAAFLTQCGLIGETCGDSDTGGAQTPVAANVFEAGQTITVTWDVTIAHPNDVLTDGVRIAIHYGPGDSFADNILATGVNAGATRGLHSKTVTLPAGKTCSGGTGNCLLQQSWVAQNDGGSYVGVADITINAAGTTPPASSGESASDVEERKDAAGGMIAVGIIFILLFVAIAVAMDVAIVMLMFSLLCFKNAPDWQSNTVWIVKDLAVGHKGEEKSHLIPALVLAGVRGFQLVLAFITMIIASVSTDMLSKLKEKKSCPNTAFQEECTAASLAWSHDFIIIVSVCWIVLPGLLIAAQLVSLLVLKKSLDFDETYARIIKIILGAFAGPFAFVVEMVSIFFLVLAVAAAGQSGALVQSSDAIASSIFGAMLLATLVASQVRLHLLCFVSSVVWLCFFAAFVTFFV